MDTPNDYFDYDGALADLREMYERARFAFSESIKPGSLIPWSDADAFYEFGLEVGYAIQSYLEFATQPEAV